MAGPAAALVYAGPTRKVRLRMRLEGKAVIVAGAGGGMGTLAALLLREHPALRIVLLERPEVAALVEVPAEVRDRFEPRAADVFQPWPVRGDAVVLARVLHDWDDEQAGRVLRHARAALRPGG